MRRAFTLAVLALSLFSFPVLPQEGPRTGSIQGIVVRADTAQPIANAQVTLTQVSGLAAPPVGTVVPGGDGGATTPGAAAIATVPTGADGLFVFKDLKPATYRVAATTDSFIWVANGQRVPIDLGRLLFVEAGQAVTDANIRIKPTGTITGRIVDEKGQPAVGATVQLIRAVYNLNGKTYQGAGTASVDDRGVYRIFAVPPGRYYLMAQEPPQRALPPPRFVLYYPGVSGLDHATAIEVKAGEESSIDMRLNRVTQTFHVRGRVINSAGGPFPQNMRALLGNNQLSGFVSAPRQPGFDPATGAFDLANVPPGEFWAIVIDSGATPREMALAASVPVHVTNADIDGLVLTLAAGLSVKGKLIVEGQPISSIPNLSPLRLNLRMSKLSGLGLPTSSAIAADGSFQVSGLRDGEYSPWMALQSPGFYVHSIKYGGKEILGTTFKFSSGDSGAFEVVLKADTQVSGKVTDSQSQPASGTTVVFVPAQRERLDLFRSTNTDQTGKFTMTNVAPGEYKVFSWEAADNNPFRDPDFLKPYEELGKAITVSDTSHPTVDVKLIPAQ